MGGREEQGHFDSLGAVGVRGQDLHQEPTCGTWALASSLALPCYGPLGQSDPSS